jgi:molybdenum cofactor cytidylyltransferase
MINAIVLAAGESKRMGTPKPLLRFGNKTFLEQIVSVLKASDVDAVTVVLGAAAQTIRESTDLSGAEIVINEDYPSGQLSSLIVALKSIPPQTQAILVCLVDSPFVTAAIVNRLVHKFKETGGPIVVPVFKKQRGHPTLFASSLFEELTHAPVGEGARHVLYSNEDKVIELEVQDACILVRIDTPQDYVQYLGTGP